MGRIVGVGAIFGIVSEDGVAKPASPVNLYDRTTGKLLSRQLTRPDGGFVFNGLNQNSQDYLLTATDEDGTTPKNALSQDRVQPVPGYSGATFWGNWANLSRTLGAVGGYTGGLDGTGQAQPMDSSVLYVGAQPAVYGQPSITPGAPNIASIDANVSNIVFPARTLAAVPDGWGKPAKISLEAVFDPTTVTGNVACIGALFVGEYYNPDYSSTQYATAALFRYDPVTKLLALYRTTSTSNSNFEYGLTQIASLDLSTATSPVHLVGTIAYGYQAKLYLNGALQVTTDLAGTNAVFYGSSRGDSQFAGTFISSTGGYGPIYSAGTTGRFGPNTVYRNKILSDTEITDLYQALMVGTLPNVSGYPKEVIMDLPAWYFRLNDPDVSISAMEFLSGNTGNANDTRAALSYNNPGLTPLAASIVTGGNALTFNGGGLRSRYVGYLTSDRKALTYSFLAKLVGTPAADEYIICERRWDDYQGHAVFRTPSNTLTLVLRENGALVNYPFTTAVPTDAMQHIVIVVDKYAGAISLWLGDTNGIAKVETLTPTTTLLDADDMTHRAYQRGVCFGARINVGITTGTDAFHGDLTEMAYFPRALTDDRILAQNAALSTV